MADSIKLFSFNREHNRYIVGIHQLESNPDGPSLNWQNWIFFGILVLWFLPSAAFFLFVADSMLDYGIAFFSAAVPFAWLFLYLSSVWQTKNTLIFYRNCERFIEKRENTITVYRELIEKIEWLCKIVGTSLMATTLLLAQPFLIYSLVNYYILDLDEESFVLFFPATWPFNWKTPLGYSVAWLMQSSGMAIAAGNATLFFNSILGSFWLFMCMAEDITKDLTAFNLDVEANKHRAEWTKRFCTIVQLYSDAKQCVNEFQTIVRYSLFVIFFVVFLLVADSLFILEFQLRNDDAKLVETFGILIITSWIFGVLFFTCEPGERITSHFDAFHAVFERCNWYTLSIGMQRMYLIFLSDTQQPKIIACYGHIQCTRETFQTITNKGWSYFMAVRRFGA